MPTIQHIAIDLSDKTVVMHFVTSEQPATDDAINREIKRSGMSPLGWRRVTPEEAADISRKLRGSE
jgi:hypothetical protein